MGKPTPYTLAVTSTASAELDELPAFEQRQVADAIDANLLFEPLSETRRRKNLGVIKSSFAYDPPLWELKVGELRVFYNVDDSARTVYVRSIRRKPHGKTTQEIVL